MRNIPRIFLTRKKPAAMMSCATGYSIPSSSTKARSSTWTPSGVRWRKNAAGKKITRGMS